MPDFAINMLASYGGNIRLPYEIPEMLLEEKL
jgi:hypothetical protein